MRKIAFALLIIIATASFANTTGSLAGRVTNRDRPVPDVKVTISSTALQGTRSTNTNDRGEYLFPSLPPGDYEVRFEARGIAAIIKKARVDLALASRADFDLQRLFIEDVTVSADVPAVIASTQIASSFKLRDIDRLPVQRNQLATAQLAPGVTANTLGNGELSISGGPGYDNLALVNGVVVTENVRSQMRPMYVEDAIEETTVLTGVISAEYGRFTGGVISTITKSGGNELSASIRDSLTNPAWSAQTPAKENRSDILNHVFDITLGGFVLPYSLWIYGAGRLAKNDTARTTIAIPAFA